MTEADWDRCGDAQKMLEALQESGMATDRKLRLFAVGCCRGLVHLLPDQHSRRTVRVAERYTDGEVSAEKLRLSWRSARWSAQATERRHRHGPPTAADYALWAVCLAVEEDISRLTWVGDTVKRALATAARAEVAHERDFDDATLLRDIMGNPFRPRSPLAPAVLAWDGGCVVKLAAAVYQERDFSGARLGVLADALEEADCADVDVLGHLRGKGPHCRGCWAVDLLTGLG